MLVRAVKCVEASFPAQFLRRLSQPSPLPPSLTATTFSLHTPLSQAPLLNPVLELLPIRCNTSNRFRLRRSCCSFGFPELAGRKLRVSTMSTGAVKGSSAGSLLAVFPLSDSSSLKIQKGDITQWSVDGVSDAIVNPANERMLGGGGADGAIHRAAGPQLKEACYKVPEVRPGVRCPTGEAKITPGFKLPAAYVVHTVGPIYDEDRNPEASLKSAYRNSLCVAKENNIQYIAFPAISCGVYRFPIDEAATIAISTVKEFGADLKEVHFVLFSDEIYDAWLEKAKLLIGN